MTGPFAKVEWSADETTFRIGSVPYLVEQHLSDADASVGFRFFKPRPMVQQYERLFASMPREWSPRTIFELGIWHGGSAAFWIQVLEPSVYVAIDYDRRRELPTLAEFDPTAGTTTERILRWDTDQTDRAALLSLAKQHMPGGIDLVIDDASHKYRQTRESFEILFPLVRAGGLYVIEDWSWSLDDDFLDANPGWRKHEPLRHIIEDLALAAVRQPDAVASVAVFRDFIAVQRGSDQPESPVLPLPGSDRMALLRRWGQAGLGRLRRASRW